MRYDQAIQVLCSKIYENQLKIQETKDEIERNYLGFQILELKDAIRGLKSISMGLIIEEINQIKTKYNGKG